MTEPQKDRALPPIPAPTCDWLALTWYPVRTNPRCEVRATAGLREAGFEVFYPVRREWIQRRRVGRNARTWQEVERPLWVGYILVGLHPGQGLYALRDTDGVYGPVRMEGVPVTLVPAKVCDVYARVTGGEWDRDHRPRRRRFERGAAIRIIDGPLSGFIATVKRDTAEDPKHVLAELLEGGKTVKVPLSAIHSQDGILTEDVA